LGHYWGVPLPALSKTTPPLPFQALPGCHQAWMLEKEPQSLTERFSPQTAPGARIPVPRLATELPGPFLEIPGRRFAWPRQGGRSTGPTRAPAPSPSTAGGAFGVDVRVGAPEPHRAIQPSRRPQARVPAPRFPMELPGAFLEIAEKRLTWTSCVCGGWAWCPGRSGIRESRTSHAYNRGGCL